MVRIFLWTFSILFVIGLVTGHADSTRVRAVALQNLTIRDNGDATYLAFECNGNVSHVYDVENNSLSRNPAQILDVSVVPIILSLRTHKDLIIAALGGSSGAVSVSTVSKAGKTPKKLASVILGFLSGYLSGYWVATRYDVDCSSSSIANLLDQPSEWKDIESDFITTRLYGLGVRDSKWLGEDEDQDSWHSPVDYCKPDISRRVTALVKKLDEGRVPDRADFLFFADYSSMLSDVRKDSTYMALGKCIARIMTWSEQNAIAPFAEREDRVLPEEETVCDSLGIDLERLAKLHWPDKPVFVAPHPSLKGSRKGLRFHEDPEFQAVCKQIFRQVFGSPPSP